MTKHACRASKRYIKTHRELVHKILNAFDILPTEFELISPYRRGPKWCPWFPIWIPTSNVEAVEAASAVRSEVMVFSDSSGQEGQIGAAMVLYRNWVEWKFQRRHMGILEQHTVFEAKVLHPSWQLI